MEYDEFQLLRHGDYVKNLRTQAYYVVVTGRTSPEPGTQIAKAALKARMAEFKIELPLNIRERHREAR